MCKFSNSKSSSAYSGALDGTNSRVKILLVFNQFRLIYVSPPTQKALMPVLGLQMEQLKMTH